MRTFTARLLRVVDGDTVELEVDTGFYNTHTDRFRLSGIDAPERDVESRQALVGLLAAYGDGWFKVLTDKTDKYGRWLVTIPLYDEASPLATINQRMIELGFAVPYSGGKR